MSVYHNCMQRFLLPDFFVLCFSSFLLSSELSPSLPFLLLALVSHLRMLCLPPLDGAGSREKACLWSACQHMGHRSGPRASTHCPVMQLCASASHSESFHSLLSNSTGSAACLANSSLGLIILLAFLSSSRNSSWC